MSSSKLMLPNFIIGGTSAGGTSFLASAIVQHPDIYLPAEMRPEPHYYYKSWEYEKGLDYYQQRWFSEVGSEAAIGERSSSYLFAGAQVAEKMKRDIPNLKLIFTLRDPAQRAWANYRYTALQGLEDTDFDTALKTERERVAAQSGMWAEIQPHNYTGRGFYGQQLLGFLEHYPAEQIHLIESEKMNANPQDTFSKLFAFLGVDTDFEPELPPLHSSVNVHNPVKQKTLREIFNGKFDRVIEAIRKDEDPSIYIDGECEWNALNELISNMTGEKQHMSDWAKSYLAELYQTDRAILEQQIGFKPEYWGR